MLLYSYAQTVLHDLSVQPIQTAFDTLFQSFATDPRRRDVVRSVAHVVDDGEGLVGEREQDVWRPREGPVEVVSWRDLRTKRVWFFKRERWISSSGDKEERVGMLHLDDASAAERDGMAVTIRRDIHRVPCRLGVVVVVVGVDRGQSWISQTHRDENPRVVGLGSVILLACGRSRAGPLTTREADEVIQPERSGRVPRRLEIQTAARSQISSARRASLQRRMRRGLLTSVRARGEPLEFDPARRGCLE